jgi:hypothetical protein
MSTCYRKVHCNKYLQEDRHILNAPYHSYNQSVGISKLGYTGKNAYLIIHLLNNY